jgi:DNA-binding IclR family transcriptional regulator
MLSESSAREVQSVRTAFRIVGTIQKRDGATLHELAGQLDVAKSTVHNYLGTLQSLGYVVERDGVYRPGLRFLTHGMAARNGVEGGEAVPPALAAVAEELSQPAWWIVEEFGRGFFVEKAVPEDGAEVYGRIGKRSYLHTHAPGKAILALLPEGYVDDVVEFHGLPPLTSKTTTSPRELRRQLETVSEQGYAVGEGETALGVQSAGVAFETPGGSVQAIGVFGYSHDFSRNTLEQDVPSVLRDAASEVERSLGGQ